MTKSWCIRNCIHRLVISLVEDDLSGSSEGPEDLKYSSTAIHSTSGRPRAAGKRVKISISTSQDIRVPEEAGRKFTLDLGPTVVDFKSNNNRRLIYRWSEERLLVTLNGDWHAWDAWDVRVLAILKSASASPRRPGNRILATRSTVDVQVIHACALRLASGHSRGWRHFLARKCRTRSR